MTVLEGCYLEYDSLSEIIIIMERTAVESDCYVSTVARTASEMAALI